MYFKIWNLVPANINKLATWFILSVDSNFKRRGLMQKLINYNLNELKELGCQGMCTKRILVLSM